MNNLLTVIIPHPDPLPLAAPPALIWFLLLLTFFLHLLPMNFILGGSIISALLGRKPDRPRQELRRFLAKAMPPMVAAAVSFGVAPLLLTQVLFGRLFFSSSVLMAFYWLSVIPILILAYYGTYLAAFKGDRLGRARPWIGGLIALLFLTISFIYSNNMSLTISPERFAILHGASAGGTALNLADPTLIPRWLHMVLGAVAVAGLVIALYGARRMATDHESGHFALRLGSHWFMAATVLNIGTGCWWLVALPRETMLLFMGGSPVASGVLMLGILAGIGALVLVEGTRNSKAPMKRLLAGSGLLTLALVGMILARDQIRRGALAAAGYEIPTWVEPRWGQLTIFLLLLVGAAVTIIWMVRKLAVGKAGG
jgi:hypothetical protein